MSFTIFQKDKSPFQAIKTRLSKSRKIDIFPKGLPIVLIQKWPFFQLFFFRHIFLENVSYDILKRRNAFLAYKNKCFKKSKNSHFPKGVHPWVLVQKWPFSTFYFRQYKPGKRLLRYSETKKRLFRLKKQEVQKVEKLTFFQTG